MKNTPLSVIMAEHVEMPGFPQLIVRRGWLYQWLTDRGWSQSERGLGSLDYTVFARDAVPQALTPDDILDRWLTPLVEEYSR